MNEACTVDSVNPYSNTSIDRAIHIWANKGSNFNTNIFSDNLKFEKSHETSAVWRRLRSFLMLDRENTDWYLCVAQTIISAFDSYGHRIKDNVFSKQVHELPQQNGPELEDVSLVNDGNEYSYFKEYDLSFPIPEEYTLTWSSKDQIAVNDNKGRNSHVALNLMQTYGEPPKAIGYSLLRGDWADSLPFKGTLRYEGLWDLGSKVNIKYFPPTINYKSWLSSIETSVHIDDILRPVGLFEDYQLAKEPLEKLAALYTALILHYDITNKG